MSEKTLKKKINSENTVSNEGCLYQNACDYIKMHVTISKCMQTVSTVLRISTGESVTLVTLLREVLKVIEKKNKFSKHCFK